jgi:TonB family protein
MFDTEEPKKKSPVAMIAIAAVAVLAIGGGFFFMKGRSSAPANAAVSTQVAAASTTGLATAPTTTAMTGTTSTDPLTGTVAVPATTTTLDPKLVDQEVQKRLAAERARLEQARAQQPAETPAVAAAPVRNTPAPVPTATQAPAPEPVQAAPVVQQPPPQVAETPRPAPAPAEPARAREGELIPTGTEGLVQPRITKRASVPYPPLAKVQKVQGTVICSVLVSETGDVLDVRVLRGNNRGVGLNEAAEQMMRRSSFAPGTKDGVRVKAWTTVPVDFKL